MVQRKRSLSWVLIAAMGLSLSLPARLSLASPELDGGQWRAAVQIAREAARLVLTAEAGWNGPGGAWMYVMQKTPQKRGMCVTEEAAALWLEQANGRLRGRLWLAGQAGNTDLTASDVERRPEWRQWQALLAGDWLPWDALASLPVRLSDLTATGATSTVVWTADGDAVARAFDLPPGKEVRFLARTAADPHRLQSLSIHLPDAWWQVTLEYPGEETGGPEQLPCPGWSGAAEEGPAPCLDCTASACR